MRVPTKGELAAAAVRDWCRADGLPEPVAEFRFLPPRRFKFDLAWPDLLLALEFQGGHWKRNGGHSFGRHFVDDCEKYTLAAVAGWRVMPVVYEQVESGQVRLWLRDALRIRGNREGV